ncbi:MAG: peptidase [Herbinix sp.]|nr:peptidase [Herbinix sp.]
MKSLMSPGLMTTAQAKTSVNPVWNQEMYGDRMDIDGSLDSLSKDATFQQEKQEQLKQQASQLNFDETSVINEETNDSNFTYDGGTKYFLNRDLDFKTFTLRSVGNSVEIWVANDLSFPEGDTRPAHVVTQEQVDMLKNEFM